MMIGKNIGRGRGKPPCREGPATRSETANPEPAASDLTLGLALPAHGAAVVVGREWRGTMGASQVETVLLILAIAA